MHIILKTLIIVFVLGVCGYWIIDNAFVSPIQNKWVLQCKVVSKGEQDKLEHHKGYTSNNGIRRSFVVHTGKYGYGDVPVTINTYMTTNVGETVTFTFSRYNMRDYFAYDDNISITRYISFSIFISLIALAITLGFMLSTPTKF